MSTGTVHWSASGLDYRHRHLARDRFKQAALLALHHAPEIHYTQGSARWQGIAEHKIAIHGEYPTEGDCSAMYSWLVWNALYVPFHMHDVVNGDQWEGGFTGTIADHGKRVWHMGNSVRGDAVLYGSGPPFEHVTGIIGFQHGKPLVFSHGSEAGPMLLPIDYRPYAEIRRFI